MTAQRALAAPLWRAEARARRAAIAAAGIVPWAEAEHAAKRMGSHVLAAVREVWG